MTRTWKEQKDFEDAVRKEWLQELADIFGDAASAAEHAEACSNHIRNLARRSGVKFKRVKPGPVAVPSNAVPTPSKPTIKPKTPMEQMAARENAAMRRRMAS